MCVTCMSLCDFQPNGYKFFVCLCCNIQRELVDVDLLQITLVYAEPHYAMLYIHRQTQSHASMRIQSQDEMFAVKHPHFSIFARFSSFFLAQLVKCEWKSLCH